MLPRLVATSISNTDDNHLAIQHSDEFYGYRVPTDFRFHGDHLQFTSAIESPCPANNTVHARFFPAGKRFKRGEKAVVVLPHWNAHSQQHVALCAGIAKTGASAVGFAITTAAATTHTQGGIRRGPVSSET